MSWSVSATTWRPSPAAADHLGRLERAVERFEWVWRSMPDIPRCSQTRSAVRPRRASLCATSTLAAVASGTTSPSWVGGSSNGDRVPLLERRPASGSVVEKEHDVALHQSREELGRHPRRSLLRARLAERACAAGKDALERFCEEREIPFERCGKLVLAVDEQAPRRPEGAGRSEDGLGLGSIDAERIREIEPHAAGDQRPPWPRPASWTSGASPAYADESARGVGGSLLGHRVTDIERMESEMRRRDLARTDPHPQRDRVRRPAVR